MRLAWVRSRRPAVARARLAAVVRRRRRPVPRHAVQTLLVFPVAAPAPEAVGLRRRPQPRVISVRFPPLDRVPEQARGVGQARPLADGEDEQPLALVGRADFRRREEACRKSVAHADQSAGDFGEAEAEMMGDILEEDEGWFDLADDAGDMRPEVARIVGAARRLPATENGWHG